VALLKQVGFGPRVPGTAAHTKCAEWLVEELRQTCESVRFQPFEHRWSVDGRTYRMANILAEQNWKDAKVRVVVLAHWDSRPFADQDPDPANRRKPVLGASDGASGVAVVLELARVLKGRLKDVGVLYLLTDGEDLGPGIEEMLLGARHFAKNLPSPRPDYGVLLDMIGDKDLRVPIERYSYSQAPGLVNELYALAARAGLGKAFPKELGEWIIDDHVPLNEAGVPTIDLIDFTYEPWHTVRDTAEQCSPESLGKVGRLMELWLLREPAYRPPKNR